MYGSDLSVVEKFDAWAPIREFLSPIWTYMEDETVSEIEINSSDSVFVECNGIKQKTTVKMDEDFVFDAVKRIAKTCGQEVVNNGDLISPELHCRFKDGSRMAVLFPPHSVGGITATIRKFNVSHLGIPELVERGMLSTELSYRLLAAVIGRENVLIAGATGTGKTTLINALAAEIDDNQRILVIENPPELRLKQPNVVRWEARRDFTQRQLLESALRHNPDRLILGEVRGKEGYELLTLLDTGHQGTLSSIHAGSCENALVRLSKCALAGSDGWPWEAIKDSVGSSINVVVHLVRETSGLRHVKEAAIVRGYNGSFVLEALGA